jgi:hypothetical protein
MLRHDFIRHAVEKPSSHQPDVYRAPEGEMDTVTSYAKEYTGINKIVLVILTFQDPINRNLQLNEK